MIIGCVNDEDPDPGDPRDKFLGTWKVSETCLKLNYEVEITYDPQNSSQVLINNFGNPGSGYQAAVAMVVNDKIYISEQETGENWLVSGEGSYLTSNEIEWEYNLTISGNLMQCNSTYYQ